MADRIRRMQEPDLPAVAGLSAELGYPVTLDELADRFAAISGHPDHALFVAEDGGAVVGWVHVHGSRLLVAPPFAELGGLVVGSVSRRRGTGRSLMEAAEGWAIHRGATGVRVRSNVTRAEAHGFYCRIGYGTTKTSHVFEKPLIDR